MDLFAWIRSYSVFGNFIVSISIGLLAIWQGVSLIAAKKLDRLKRFDEEEIKKSRWYKVKSLDGIILLIIIIGFVMGSIFQYFHIKQLLSNS